VLYAFDASLYSDRFADPEQSLALYCFINVDTNESESDFSHPDPHGCWNALLVGFEGIQVVSFTYF
jgi:hypothetical protein